MGDYVTSSTSENLEQSIETLFNLAEHSWKQAPRKGQSWCIPLTIEFKDFIRNLIKHPDSKKNCVMHQVEIYGTIAMMKFSMKTSSKLFTLYT